MLGLVSCGHSKFRTYNGPEITLVEVHKADRKMYLLHNGTILHSYDIELGGAPVGKKQFEGDKKTPEGAYFITHRNPNSTYHLSLGISYPNDDDIAFAKAAGKKPGDNIFIHGQPGWTKVRGDWTVGCIALTDRQMEDVYAMVKPGTPINIFP
ncbi:L,D-transpeptidase family protein [bacterium]|nr:L,D-transpeptidase family protein [bacterium]